MKQAGYTRQAFRAGLTAALAAICAIVILIPGAIHAGDRRADVKTLFASGARTAATAYSSGVLVSAYIEGQILVTVTSETGTSTLDITVQTSDDNSTYYDHTTITQITATGQYRQAISNFGKYVRLKYVLGGTGYTFAAVGVFKN